MIVVGRWFCGQIVTAISSLFFVFFVFFLSLK